MTNFNNFLFIYDMYVFKGYENPVFGVQWHPEKTIFEWTPDEVIQHTYHAETVSRIAANFFVSEARKSRHSFANEKEERERLIYNYNPIYQSKEQPTSFEQIYRFPCC